MLWADPEGREELERMGLIADGSRSGVDELAAMGLVGDGERRPFDGDPFAPLAARRTHLSGGEPGAREGVGPGDGIRDGIQGLEDEHAAGSAGVGCGMCPSSRLPTARSRDAATLSSSNSSCAT